MMMAVTGIMSCIIALAILVGYYFLRSQDVVSKPLVLIHAPNYGQQLEVGQVTSVHAVARDANKIVRFELWVDGQLHKTDTSSIPGGISPFPMLTDWQPLVPGSHTLTVRAFNVQGTRSQASINVESIEVLDQDNDGVADDMDACPDQPGFTTTDGCPDHDSDGVADGIDICPDEAGLPETDGCPSASEGDRDGDGILDEDDICPDESGPGLTEGCPDSDGDLVPDTEDACPDEAGWADREGCPTPGDTDGDGLLDGDDACPDEWGLPEHSGCPDEDGDGILDSEDACPSEPGPAETGGCPDADGDTVPDDDDLVPDVPGPPEGGGAPPGPDSDGDGAPDDADPCPDEYGEAEDGFCPPPEDDMAATEDSSFFEIPPFGMDALGIPVEFQALEFGVDDHYEDVWCYFGVGALGDEYYRRIEFTPEPGERHWDLRTYLGEEETSQVLWAQEDQLIHVKTECYGPPSRSGGSPVYLYETSELHGISDWDGHDIAIANRHSEGVYRLCRNGCENDYFPPPHLFDAGFSRSNFYWGWDWPRERDGEIRGFKLYVDGNFVASATTDHRWFEIPLTEPNCGERVTLQVSAWSGADARVPEIESPLSNPLVWAAEACPRTVRVTFITLAVHNRPGDERGQESVGPIYGDFFVVSGSSLKSLRFDGAHILPPGPWNPLRGLRLAEIEYDILNIFNWIRRQERYHPLYSYSAPSTNSLVIELGSWDDLVIGGDIMDTDLRNSNDVIFDEQETVRVGGTSLDPPLTITISGRYLDLIVKIEPATPEP